MRQQQTVFSVLVAGALCAMLCGCALPKIPQSASWDTEIAVPLAQHTYWLADVADTTLVHAQSGSGIGMTLPDSALFFSYIKDIAPVHPGDNLKLDPLDYSMEKRLNTIRVPLNVRQDHTASLTQLNSNVAARHGTICDVAAFPFQIVMDAPLSGDFTLACVDTGSALVTIRNSLPYALNTLAIDWMADRDHAIPLYAGAMRATADTSYSTPLNGQCLGGTMFMTMNGTAAGGSQVLVDSTQGITVTMTVGDVEVSRYTGLIRRQSSIVDSTFDLHQQHDVTEAEIASGTLTISSSNASPLADSVRLLLDNLRTPSGGAVVFEEYHAPQQSREMVYDLAGYTIQITNPAVQEIHGRQETILLATDAPVTFEADHQHVSTSFHTSELHFRRFTGVVHNLEATMDADSSSVDQPPDGWENVHAANLDLALTIHSAISLAADMQVNLHSMRGGAVIGSQQRTADFTIGGDTTLNFYGLEELVTRIPEWICYAGTVNLNGPVTVYDTTTIGGKVVLNAPLRFTLGTTHVPGETQKVEPEAMEDVQQVTLKIQVWNALPLMGTLKLIAAFDSVAALANSGLPAETLCVVSLPPAVISGERVVAPGYREIEVTPPDGSYEFLRRPPFFVRPDLTINGTDGDTLIADGTDYVKFSATANVRYRVSTEGGK